MLKNKIAKFVTRRQVESQNLISQSVNSFVAEARKLFEKYDEDNVLNTDQIGIELELHSNRTLAYQGEKITVASVRSINATTHSYTVQQTISLGGHLIGPVSVCLKEIKGQMSDNIKVHLFKPDNVVCACNASGKLTTTLAEYWRDHVLAPSSSENSEYLLLFDWWTT